MLVTAASGPAIWAVRLPQKFSAATTRTPLVAAGPAAHAPSRTVAATAIPNPVPIPPELRMVLIFASYGGGPLESRTGTMLISGRYAGPMPAHRTDTGVHEAVAARLADRDGRYTGSRRDLIQALAEAGRPLTVDEIVVRAPRQRPSSVYRNLAVFEAEGGVPRPGRRRDPA